MIVACAYLVNLSMEIVRSSAPVKIIDFRHLDQKSIKVAESFWMNYPAENFLFGLWSEKFLLCLHSFVFALFCPSLQ